MSINKAITKFILRRLGDEKHGYDMPPGSSGQAEFGRPMGVRYGNKKPYTVIAQEDGCSIWIANNDSDEWNTHFFSDEAVEMAKFILVDWWVKATWCGLKRKIWYAALSAQLRQHKAEMSRTVTN